MNIFKKYSNELNLIENNYSKQEVRGSYLGSFLATMIIAFPVVLVLIQLFSIFLMRPYLMLIITALSFDVLFLLFIVFKNSILKKYRIVEEISYKYILIFEYIVTTIFVIIIALLLALVLIPLVVL